MVEPTDRQHEFDRGFRRFRERRRRRRHHRPPVFMGSLLLILGVLFLLDNLDIVETRGLIRTFWPTLILGWGVVRLASGRAGERVMGAVAVFFGGVLLGNRLLGWDVNIMAVFWPLILIGVGLSMLSRGWGGRSAVRATVSVSSDPGGSDPALADDSSGDTSSALQETAVMAGIHRRNVSQTFRGGDVTAIMGSVEVDLRDCRMGADEVQVGVFVLMGETVFRIPRDWTVESRVSAVLANVEDESEPPVGATAKRFVILGSAVMGNVEIRN